MYDPHALLAQIDSHKWPILVGFGIAMVFQWVWLVDAVRTAKRDAAYSIPLFCTFFWFAHDTGCVVRFSEWFNTYDNWYLKLFWVGLSTAFLLELVFFSQIIRYGRAEVLPGLSARLFTALIVGTAIVSYVCWEIVKEMLGDPVYQASPALTMVSYPLFGAALMVRRRSADGQSVVMWGAFTAMTVCWFVTAGLWFTAPFRSWQYIAAGLIAAVGGAMMTLLVHGSGQRGGRSPRCPGQDAEDDVVARVALRADQAGVRR